MSIEHIDDEVAPKPHPRKPREPAPSPAESFDAAQPVPVDRQSADQGEVQVRPQGVGKNGVLSEEYLIGCCLLDEGMTLDRAITAGVSTSDFSEHVLATIYGALRTMRKRGTPIGLDTLLPELGTAVSEVGGIVNLMALADPAKLGTTAHAGHHIQKILRSSATHRAVSKAKELIERADRGEDVGEVEDVISVPQARPITSYAYPQDDDPNTLLGNDDYLGRGGGMLFVSHAGAGKSSWIMDACMMWALGRPWMGIKCNPTKERRGLKSLIVQAEDSDRYIGKVFASFAHVNKLTEPEIEQLKNNCVIVRLKGVCGEAFERALKKLTVDHAPDLVAINPTYLYAQGDISKSEFAQPFLVGLDRVNKEEKWAYILIHHTGKPGAKGKDGKRAETEDWESAYMGFGSSYFANWPRCSALLEPVSGAQGKYTIKLGKGGFNAGVTKQNEFGMGATEPTTRIAIRHSTERMDVAGRDKPVYYWEIDDTPAPESTTKAGRPAKYKFEDFISIMPAQGQKPATRNSLYRFAQEISPIKETAFREMLFEAYQAGKLARTQDGQGYLYRLAGT